MFDWNDEELTNIIWGGEAGEGDDHIVPYQEGRKDYHNKQEFSQQATTIRPSESKLPGTKIDFHGKKLESSSNFISNERISASGSGMGSCSDLSLSNAAKTDDDPIDTEVSNDIDEITNNNSTGAMKAELEEDPENFQNSHEDKDQGDIDYSWANIGSFDDLDRIFSNDDPIFGRVSLGSADELWPSTKDATNSPVKSFPLVDDSPSLEIGSLNNLSEQVEVKSEFEPQDDQSLTLSHGELSNPAQDLQNAHGILDHVEYPRGESKPKVKEQTELDTRNTNTALNSDVIAENVTTLDNFTEKGYRQKNLLKGRKKPGERNEEELLQDFYGTWSSTGNSTGKHENQLAHSILQSSPSLVLSKQRQFQKSEALQYQQIPSSFVTSAYGNLTNSYPGMPLLSHIQSGKFKQQPLLPCNEVSPGKANFVNKSAAASPKTLTMTPQEKIEKLRRRQQMQAMLAIQKQQQQFSHQVSSMDHSIPQKFQENQIQLVDGADLEVDDLCTLPCFEPNSPIEQDDSSAIYLALDNYSLEETVLYQLQDVISKLDVRIRLCIRDSLFRLAQSVMLRHYDSDTSSTNKTSRDKPEVVAKAETNSSTRYARMSDVETETNPIDRAVACLLFHRPLELLGKPSETPESPASTKFHGDARTMDLMNLPVGCMPESSNITQNFSHLVSKDPCQVPEPQRFDQFKTNPGIDTSENASNYGTAVSVAAEVEVSE